MSDFSTDDFHAAGQLVSNLLSSTRTAPKKFLDLQTNLQSLRQLLNELELQAKNPFSILRQRCQDRRREWLGILDSVGNTLCDIQDNMKRASMSAWTRWFRYGGRKRASLKTLKRELRLEVGDVEKFVRSLGLSPLGRQDPVLGRMERVLLEEVREERTGERSMAVLAAHETNDPVVWREVNQILIRRGVGEEDLWRHDARLKQLLHWVVKNEPDITAVLEMQDEDFEKVGSGRGYDRKE